MGTVNNFISFYRPVVMNIMKHLPKIKAEYLEAIRTDKEMYKEAAVEVKQQIWQDDTVSDALSSCQKLLC